MGDRRLGGGRVDVEVHAEHLDVLQHHVGALVFAALAAVVIGEREIGGIDAGHVAGHVDHAVRAPQGMRTLLSQFHFERRQKGIEKIQEQPVGALDELAFRIAHQGAEDDWRRPFRQCSGVDPLQGLGRPFHRTDEW